MGGKKRGHNISASNDNCLADRGIFAGVLIISVVIFSLAKIFEDSSLFVLSGNSFLVLHIILELLSIVMSFCIFAITYYTSEQTRSREMIIIACTFLSVTLMDVLHTFSYKGMPDFITPASPEKATLLWITSRLIMSIGMLAASLTSAHKRIRNHQWISPLAIALLTIGLSLVIVHRPDLFPPVFIDGKGLTPLKILLEYIVSGLLIFTAFIYHNRCISGSNNKAYNFVIIGLLVGAIGEFAFTLYDNVYDTYNLLGHFYKFVSYYLLFKGLFVINIQKPYDDLSLAERKLNNYVDDLEDAVIARTEEITRANKKIMKNLQDAKLIQMALMTTDFPRVAGMEFAAKYLPCEQVGGDFYNVFRLDDNNIGIVIGDVAGHGVSAAMVNVFVNQNMRFRVDYDENKYRILTPRGVLMNLYHVYNNMSFPEEIYVVLFYGIYNTETRTLSYASAGMNTYPLILGADGDVSRIELDGFPICKFGKFFKPNYETETLSLDPGDTLVFYSDGLGEIDRRRPTLFSTGEIKEFLRGTQDSSAQDICDDLFDAYNTLLGDKEMLDDVTILVVKTPGDVA